MSINNHGVFGGCSTKCRREKTVELNVPALNSFYRKKQQKICCLFVAVPRDYATYENQNHLCFWPPLNNEPLGPMFVLYPSGSFLINSSAFAVSAASSTLSMSIFFIRSLYPIFSATVPENSV